MSAQTPSKTRLNSISRLLDEKGAEQNCQLLATHLWSIVADEDIAVFSDAEIVDMTMQLFEHFKFRKPGRASVKICNRESDNDDAANITIISVVNDNMPFLIDSTINLLTELGHTVSLVAHPLISVERDIKGKLLKVAADATASGNLTGESLSYFHIEELSDQNARDVLVDEIERTLRDVRASVLDWQAMRQRIKQAISDYQRNPPPVPVEELTESMDFLQWLLDDHLTILGIREYAFTGGAENGSLSVIEDTGLGVLRNRELKVLTRHATSEAITPEIRNYLRQPAALIINKSDSTSRVHRRILMDYIGIKQFDNEGELTGEIRVVGLFTSTVYTRAARKIPLLRRKINSVLNKSGFDLHSHSGKALLNILETFPRDELFQIEVDELHAMAQGILRLEERPRTRLFVRHDRFDRFVSAYVFIPRERFNSEIRSKVGDLLASSFEGKVTRFSPFFSEGRMVRVHFIISRNKGQAPDVSMDKLEADISDVVRTWDDRLGETIGKNFGRREAARLLKKYAGAFSAGYEEAFSPQASLYDIAEIEELQHGDDMGVHFFDIQKEPAENCRLKLYHFDEALPLSARLPILENMGLKAIEENSFTASPIVGDGPRTVFIHEVILRSADGSDMDMRQSAGLLEECFLAVWQGRAENDRFNGLVLKADMNWRDAALMRACGKYLRQLGIAYSSDYMADALVANPQITKVLVQLFYQRFDIGLKGKNGKPLSKAKRRPMVTKMARKISELLQDVPGIDEDLIVRRYLNLVRSINRTNFFMCDGDCNFSDIISFKIESSDVEEMPEPRPFAEIFVYAPDFEGVHLRGGPIARGGIRWSDRPEDFRTEVLGLAKAQNVKNAVIVPVGSKGGFVPKFLPVGGTRDEIYAEGKRVYKRYINSLIELTDNLEGEKVIPPKNVVRNDDDDPYLVVAADKGTASFSDTANRISQEHGFWLDDAFASGGSAGYDHKKMGITARGGWEAVKRHFREMNIDTQSEPITVIGIGDMSGDVFGNGMLLSEKIELIAAFDHRDIFIDPKPDHAKSLKERQRLYDLPRSSWKDFDSKLISKGGGVFSRTLKAIPLSAQMRKTFGLSGKTATPNQLIQAILKARADLLWFGGIGTYIRASSETNADAGDRANDQIRITAADLKVKVVAEGANLGITQRARIEFALNGGRINTDAIDNSAGVNSSDVEVNFKIGLGAAEKAGKLKREQRNKLLASMTGDVAKIVLRNNYLQTLCLSICQMRGASEFGYTKRLMQSMEADGLLNRQLEYLPDGTALDDRSATGLTRPEMSVLIAYSKIALSDNLLASMVPDDPYLEKMLFNYFPDAMASKYGDEIRSHKLRREIVATMLANSIINRGGPSFIYRLREETGHDAAAIAKAFIIARDAYDFAGMNNMVDELDNRIDGMDQLKLYVELQRVLRRATVWFLLNEDIEKPIEQLVAQYRSGIETLVDKFETVLPDSAKNRVKQRFEAYRDMGVPVKIAKVISRLRHLQRGTDIVKVAARTDQKIETVARTFYEVGHGLAIDRLFAASARITASDYYDRLAVNRTLDGIVQTHRSIVSGIMKSDMAESNWEYWSKVNEAAINRVIAVMDDLLKGPDFNLAKLAVAASQLNALGE